jgi:hypothetical protein
MVEGARSRRLARRAECCRILRNNPEYREAENEQQRNRQLDPEYREARHILFVFDSSDATSTQ